jgi:FAD/FMN-containing dehydrogenase
MNYKQEGGGYDDNVTIITVSNYNKEVYDKDKELIIEAKKQYDKSLKYDTKAKVIGGIGSLGIVSGIGYAYKDQLKDLTDSVSDLF